MTREQERQELYKTIWQIANDLRGSVDGWDFKAYVLGMLAYRYLSESLAGELNRGEREAGAVDFDYARQDECLEGQDRLNFVQNRGYYIEPGLLFENVMQRGEDELNIYLDKALRQIEASGEGTGAAKMFEGLFTDMDLNSNKLGSNTEERNRRLKKLMQNIGGLRLGTYMNDRVGSIGRAGGVESGVDIFGDAYEYLMTMYAANAGKSGGEYFTPPEVSELLARIVTENGKKKAPRGEWRCYDPTCGSGGLLLKFLKILEYRGEVTLHGQEKNVTTYNLCRVNMLLHGMNWSKLYIRNGDTLINPDPDLDERKPFDAIVSNPPYSLKWVGEDDINLVQDARFQGPGRLAPKGKADLAFVMHSLRYLADDGIAAIVCFPGVLYRTGAEAKIREWLVEQGHVDAVIGLPGKLFFGTGITTAILVLKKGLSDGKTLFVDASKYFVPSTNSNKLSDENIQGIMKILLDRKDVDHVAKLADKNTIREQEYNLSVSMYVEKEDTSEKIDIDVLEADIEVTVKREAALRQDIDGIVAMLRQGRDGSEVTV